MSAFRRRWLPIAAVCLTLPIASTGLSGCSKNADTAAKDGASQSQAPEKPKTPTTGTAGRQPTVADYIKQNEISETPVKQDDPDAPAITMPAVMGWEDAGENTPPDAYAAIINVDPAFEADPPSVVLVFSKLGSNADPAEILKLAPNELKNLAEFNDSKTAPENFKLAGYDAVRYGGTYLRDGNTRLIAQETVTIPGKDGLYVMQINGDGAPSQVQALTLALNGINEQGTITFGPLPSVPAAPGAPSPAPESPASESPATSSTKPGG